MITVRQGGEVGIRRSPRSGTTPMGAILPIRSGRETGGDQDSTSQRTGAGHQLQLAT